MDITFRGITILVLLLTFSISATFRKRAREEGGAIERKEEGLLVFAMRMVFALPLLISLLLYIFYPRALVWSTISLPYWLRSLFAVVALLCVPIIWWVFRSIGENISETVLIKEEHQLVISGPYRWVRHPLYAGTLLLLCSISVIAENWFIFAYFIIAVIAFRFLVIPEEEKRLVAAFGDGYVDYKRRTGALAPRILRGRSPHPGKH